MINHTHKNPIPRFATTIFTAPLAMYAKQSVFVPPVLAKWLRPHQREGVQFVYECVMGLKDFDGAGCILADDMGLGKVGLICRNVYFLLMYHFCPPNISISWPRFFCIVYWKMMYHDRLSNLSLLFGHYSKQALLPTRHVLPIVSLLFVHAR